MPVLVGAASLENGSYGVAFVLDVTERKVAEEALRESEERCFALTAISPDLRDWETDAQHPLYPGSTPERSPQRAAARHGDRQDPLGTALLPGA